MRIALAQINSTVGDLDGNRDKIIDYIGRAQKQNVDLIAFPEMVLPGYPTEDLLLKPDYVQDVMDHLRQIVPATKGITAIIGTIYAEQELYNAAVVMHDGKIAGVYRKQFLPNYGVFDENRYFQAGQSKEVFIRDSVVMGVSVCEDIWYPDGPPKKQASEGGATLLINISASPYHMGKGAVREQMLATRARDNRAFIVYCNLVGGQDELVFDGQSLICDPQGDVIARGKQFEEDLLLADVDQISHNINEIQNSKFERIELDKLPSKVQEQRINPIIAKPLDRLSEVYNALILGTRDYIQKNGFKQVVLGLSGGIDSTLTAVIAADAIGAENVTGIAMPTRYSSDHSLTDAEQLTKNMGMNYRVIPIDDTFQSFLNMLKPMFEGKKEDVTEENIQSRIRGVVLMGISNKFGSLVLTTGNKSETGVGYSTLYGDTAGGFAVIKDVPKLLVYELCRYRNQISAKVIIPENVINKPPSAELRPDQKDSDSLPDYSILDAIIHAYVEDSCSIQDIVKQGYDEPTVRRIIRLIDRNEYKRRQSPPGIKITPRAFGKDWRLPITNRYSH